MLSIGTALFGLVLFGLWLKLLVYWLLLVLALTVLFVLPVPFVFKFDVDVPATVALLTGFGSWISPDLARATMAKNIPKTSANINIKIQKAGKQHVFVILLQEVESFEVGFYYFVWGFRFWVPLWILFILK